MLKTIENKVKEKLVLPKSISYTPFVVITNDSVSKKGSEIVLMLASQGNVKADSYYKDCKQELLKQINDITKLIWKLDKQNNFTLVSGYIVFYDCENGIEEYHKIEGCEYFFDSIYQDGKETTTHTLGNWEPNLESFEFAKELPK